MSGAAVVVLIACFAVVIHRRRQRVQHLRTTTSQKSRSNLRSTHALGGELALKSPLFSSNFPEPVQFPIIHRNISTTATLSDKPAHNLRQLSLMEAAAAYRARPLLNPSQRRASAARGSHVNHWRAILSAPVVHSGPIRPRMPDNVSISRRPVTTNDTAKATDATIFNMNPLRTVSSIPHATLSRRCDEKPVDMPQHERGGAAAVNPVSRRLAAVARRNHDMFVFNPVHIDRSNTVVQ